MKGFISGLLVGLGVGLLIMFVRDEELRAMFSERLQEARGYLPNNEQLNQYVSQVTDRVSQTGSNLKDYAQQATSMVKDTGSSLGDLAQKAAGTVKQTGQDVADTTKRAAQQNTK